MRVVPKRPSQYHLIYRVRGIPLRRVDVNHPHRPLGICTHEHVYDPRTGDEPAAKLLDFPAPPANQHTIDLALWRESFFAFAERCNVEADPGCWIDPVIGGH